MTSYWLDRPREEIRDPLPGDDTFETLVVGAGLTGLTTARGTGSPAAGQGRRRGGLSVARRVLTSLALLALLLTGGCGLIPSRPDASGWTDAARQSLEDAASEVSTVRVTVEQQKKGDLLGKYGVVTATTSEEALGKAQDTILTQQPPESRQQDFDKVSAALGDAGDLVTEARIALVAGQRDEYDALVRRLEQMAKRLDQLRGDL